MELTVLPLQQLRRDVGRYVRLLGIGLPLTIVFGWLPAVWFFPHFGFWLALLVGAALAPTDAALGIPVVTNPAVPSRIRQLITVESGLNDGIATPAVMVAIAGAAAAAGLEGAAAPVSAAVAPVQRSGSPAAPNHLLRPRTGGDHECSGEHRSQGSSHALPVRLSHGIRPLHGACPDEH
jgi:hypothetical protein